MDTDTILELSLGCLKILQGPNWACNMVEVGAPIIPPPPFFKCKSNPLQSFQHLKSFQSHHSANSPRSVLKWQQHPQFRPVNPVMSNRSLCLLQLTSLGQAFYGHGPNVIELTSRKQVMSLRATCIFYKLFLHQTIQA